ncbi:MAG TPA: energy transducer TonB [Pyrinomonadaceae bacterium]|nr:energy transducer TonB [Pyrinomonadaceae bacterium]
MSTQSYQPTIIDNRFLLERLAIQIAFLNHELQRTWSDFKNHPAAFARRSTRLLWRRFINLLSASNATAVVVVASMVMAVLLIDRAALRHGVDTNAADKQPLELVYLSLTKPADATADKGIGKNGSGRVGFQSGTGEGSGPSPRHAQGGGGGGDHNPLPPQTGKLPPPSNVFASIPTTPPINPPTLPAAGIDIDPALWKDLKSPVYGDPNSTSEARSKGPGEGEGIGTNSGLGVGAGDGPGVGPGSKGNTGGGSRQAGCCGSGSSGGSGGPVNSSEVEQRARLLLKPEPQYTEEARVKQITGTVVLRVVFSSSGEVVQIRAMRTLPFGLTERAIAAAHQIRFVPAMKGGRPVSVFMQLEYNFNLY